MNSTLLKLPLILTGLLISQSAISETRFSLPRETEGVELLVGVGASYDNSAFIGEETATEATPALALMTENFYLDIHHISYRKSLNINLDIKVFGVQDGLPTDDNVDRLNAKSGNSFDVGLSAEKRIGNLRVGGLLSTDVTGTHSGYLLEATIGKDINNKQNKLGFTLGGRYQDKKRNNYFYGVTKDEAIGNISEYDADGEWTAFLNAKFSHQLTRNLGIMIDADISTLGSQAKNSPRIDNNAKYLEQEIFAGLIWQFSVY